MKREVAPAVGPVLIDLSLAHRGVPELRFAAPITGTWNGFSLAGYAATLSLDGSTLRLLVEAKDSAFRELYHMMGVRNQPMTLELADGATIDARLAHMTRLSTQAQIRLDHWTLSTSQLPLVWIGRIEGHFPPLGNLSLTRRGTGWSNAKSDGFMFAGQYDWYILPQGEHNSPILVVDTRGASAERAIIDSDMLGLKLTLGGDLRVPHLVGCDHAYRVVAAMSVGGLERPRKRYRPPVPHRFNEAHVWMPQFFKLLAHKLATGGFEPLLIAISAYLDAQADHLDGAYLKA